MVQRPVFSILFVLLVLLTSCSDNPKQPHEILADQIVDYWFAKVGGQEKQISHLPNFDQNNIDHWRALLHYGEFHTSAASKLGKTRIIFFANTDRMILPNASGEFNNDLYSKIFAFYAGYANGKQSFSTNPYLTFEDSFFKVYEENKAQLKEHYIGVD